MAPILKVDPTTGESLDKSKTPAEAAAEEARRLKALEEYKERVKEKKPRKKKAVVEEEPKVALKAVEPVPVKVNPFVSPNGEIVVDDLLAPLNAVLKDVEEKLKHITKGYKLPKSGETTELPREFVYKPGVTRVKATGTEAFNLNNPSGVTSLQYDKIEKDLYVDRVMLSPLDVRELLKDPDKAFELLYKLIVDGMFKNLFETKNLDVRKKYFGETIATIKRAGSLTEFCSNFRDEYVEIRLRSDATEIK